MAKTGTITKSAKTGKIVSPKYAAKHSSTTFKQTVKIGPTKKQ